MPQVIWFEDQIPLLTELNSLAPQLTLDYLEGHPDLEEAVDQRSLAFVETLGKYDSSTNMPEEPSDYPPGFELWRFTMLKWYDVRGQDIEGRLETAKQLVNRLDQDIMECTYLIMKPGANLIWHRDLENQDRSTIRLHIPLIIPEGDLGLELEGVDRIERWDRPFAFDNQCLHRAWNRSSRSRLIFSASVLRSSLGIEPYSDQI